MRLGTFYRQIVLQMLNLPLSGNRVLDIGGYDGFILSKLPGTEKTLIDMNTSEEYANIKYINDDFITFNFNNEKFNTVLALDVIEHVQDSTKFVNKMISLLSSDGVAIISTPTNRIRVFPPFLQSWVDRKWQHFYRRGFSRSDIDNMMNGFPGDLKYEVREWNCPFFRFFYLPISVLWRVCPGIAKTLLRLLTKVDSRFSSGQYGYLFIIVRKSG